MAVHFYPTAANQHVFFDEVASTTNNDYKWFWAMGKQFLNVDDRDSWGYFFSSSSVFFQASCGRWSVIFILCWWPNWEKRAQWSRLLASINRCHLSASFAMVVPCGWKKKIFGAKSFAWNDDVWLVFCSILLQIWWPSLTLPPRCCPNISL